MPSFPRSAPVLFTLAVMVSACQATVPGSTNPRPTSLPATATQAATPSALPLSVPRPTDLTTNGTCEQGHSCLGLLKPGVTYRTATFRPPISFSVPAAGWENVEEEGGVFQLLPTAAPGDVIAFFGAPRATEPTGGLARGVGSSVQDLASWLASNDQLDVTPAKPVTVGGLSGVTMDIRVSASTTAHPPDCPVRACVVFFSGKDPSSKPTWEWDWGSAGSETQRLYLLTAQDRVVAIFVDSLDGTTFDTMTAAASEILRSVRFG